MKKLNLTLIVLVVWFVPSYSWNNGAAVTPPRGFSNWNMWHNNFNASLFRSVAQFMKDSGLQQAGYNFITLGGIGYANSSGPGQNITRNASGYLVVDPTKFPGGNNGMKVLTDDIRMMGFKWGSYTEAGTQGCDGSHGASEGYEEKDAALFFGEWGSEYLMVDSCGIKPRSPPYGPPPGTPGGQARWEMSKWKELIQGYQTQAKPIVLHDCHNGCGSNFAGPTLTVTECNKTDAGQLWFVSEKFIGGKKSSSMINVRNGLCSGCSSSPDDSCGNTASQFQNGSGVGYGMQACLIKCTNKSEFAECEGAGLATGLGAHQSFNYTTDGFLVRSDGPTFQLTLGNNNTLVVYLNERNAPVSENATWDINVINSTSMDLNTVQFQLRNNGTKMCLSSAGEYVVPNIDPWCISNNNMWRSNTDVLQTWSRTMIEVESMANQGYISRPGAWSFPDCLEVGVPGEGSYTWEEAKSVVALFAVTSSPLLLGNDVREGRMQPRLVDLMLNADMLDANSQYNQKFNFAGGRVWSGPLYKEVWAKPLVSPANSVAAVLFNRGGYVIGQIPSGESFPPHCSDPNSQLGPCVGCFVDYDKPWLSPCDDNTTASTGMQSIELQFSLINASWLGLEHSQEAIQCHVYDIFATPQKGEDLGVYTNSFQANIPPHGVRFVRLSNCSTA
eukprot:m.345013 g.345013  ORF g.345013 m.345013 type:complete len:671 (+) comp25672_c0_seq1:63-2075(+)